MSKSEAIIFPSFPLKTLSIPFRCLPIDKEARDIILEHYFQDVITNCKLFKNSWKINLFWPTSHEFYIDPKIKENAAEWASNVSVSDIPFSLKDYGKYQESLNDSWTLYAWSKWCENLGQRKKSISKITILHIDDHNDLMAPKIYLKNENLYSLLTNQPVSIYDSKSVKSAIMSSSIGIGEFILPFLWEVPFEVEIRHLCQREKNDTQNRFSLELNCEPDLLQPHLQRLVGKAEPCLASSNKRIIYFTTKNANELLSIEKKGPILLHIDLDYFNNRYDGCSNWQEKKNIYDPQQELIRFSLISFLEILKSKGLMPYIENVAVSTSPGFFPSEYWNESLTLLKSYFLP